MKTYKLLYGYFIQIWVQLSGGKSVQVEFTGGTKTPVERPGLFRTDDKAIQDGLEAHPWFDKRFYLADNVPVAAPSARANVSSETPTTRDLINSMQDPAPDLIVPLPTPVPKPVPVPTPVRELVPPQDPAPESDSAKVADITNGQDAKRWLYDNRQVPIGSMKNNEAILAAAAAQKVVFPDWNIG